jgi:cell cycle protein kinase DBF2
MAAVKKGSLQDISGLPVQKDPLQDVRMDTAKGLPNNGYDVHMNTAKGYTMGGDVYMDTARPGTTLKPGGFQLWERELLDSPEVKRKATVAQLCECHN